MAVRRVRQRSHGESGGVYKGRTTLMVMTVWSLLEECAGQLDEPFRRSEIVGWFRRHHPDVNEATLAAHIQAATANAANRARNNPLGRVPRCCGVSITACMSGRAARTSSG